MRPDIRQIAYIIGMPRAGTTSLYHNLGNHPQLKVPFRRKTNFFCLHPDRPLAWFLDHFDGLGNNQLGIDTATLHFANRNLPTLQRIYATNPNAKVMLFVRQPASWAWSFYRQIATFDHRVPPFETFLQGGYVLNEDGHNIAFDMGDGDIKARIAEAQHLFRGNIMIADFDLFADDLLGLLHTIEVFLDVRHYFTAQNISPEKINAHDRANIVGVQRFLRSPTLISVLRFLPRSFVTAIRRAYDKSGTILGGIPARNSPPDLGDISRRYFPSDEAFVSELFAKTRVLGAEHL